MLRGQREWQTKQVKVKAFDALEQRHGLVQLEHMKKLEQRAMQKVG